MKRQEREQKMMHGDRLDGEMGGGSSGSGGGSMGPEGTSPQRREGPSPLTVAGYGGDKGKGSDQ